MPDKVASCNKCGAPIMFMTQKGKVRSKSNPIERHAHPKGNVKISYNSMTYEFATKEEIEQDRAIQENGGAPTLRLSHFAVCKFAQQFRKKKQ